MSGEKDIDVDVLFVALTRSATIGGIPYTAFVIEVMAVVIVFLATANPLYLLIGLPIHAVLYLISANDPGVFDVIRLWFITNARCQANKRFWGSVSVSPIPTKQRQ